MKDEQEPLYERIGGSGMCLAWSGFMAYMLNTDSLHPSRVAQYFFLAECGLGIGLLFAALAIYLRKERGPRSAAGKD